jgi:IstB-like ATP binding protein
LLGKWAMNQMMINVSTRRFKRSVRLPEGDVPASDGAGLSKSATSHRFVAFSAARMKAWMETSLDDLDLLAIQIDGIHMDEDMLLVAAIGVEPTSFTPSASTEWPRPSPISPPQLGEGSGPRRLARPAPRQRDERLTARLSTARLRQQASVEDVDYRAARGLDRTLFQKLSKGEWIDAHDNLALVRSSGLATLCLSPYVIDIPAVPVADPVIQRDDF